MTTKANIKVGRRKTAVSRVILTQGSGKFVINDKSAENYFTTPDSISFLLHPLKVTNTLGTYDVKVKVVGGGLHGQLGAIRLGISRALVEYNEELRKTLRAEGLLTRDPRMVERKKYGQPKARKRFQFSKR